MISRAIRRGVVFLVGMGAALSLARPAAALLPVSGVPVPAMQDFEDAMQNLMATYGITAGVLAISHNGCIVYQRGFGYLSPPPNPVNLPENTPMRIASVEKPLTAAAIRKLVANGQLNWNDFAFNLGQPEGGVLLLVPWQSLGDPRLDDITIQQIFNHRGGWNRDTAPIGDPQFKTLQIAQAMGIPSPAQRDDIIRYMLSQPLEFTPGTNGCVDDNNNPTFCYSNFGYMVLGRIVEQVSGLSDASYIRANVLTPDLWVPGQEIIFGRTFRAQQSPREPNYDCPGCSCTNVYDPGGDPVSCPYGGWNHEAFLGHGNLVIGAMPLLVYMDSYQVGVGGASGMPLTPGNFGGGVHTGAIDGTSTVMWQRNDGNNIVVLFNRRAGSVDFALTMGQTASDLIDAGGFTWPTFCVDGFWVDFNAPSGQLEVGGYDTPYRTMPGALGVGAGAKLRFKPGTSTWTGTIAQKVRMDSPFGLTRIGG